MVLEIPLLGNISHDLTKISDLPDALKPIFVLNEDVKRVFDQSTRPRNTQSILMASIR